MTRIYKYALTAVLSAMVVMPAFAQDNFPDVPDNHWAYEALARMKREGVLVGYPDGLFRGGRPATRYEMAVAIHAAFTHLKNLIDGLNGQIEDIKRQMSGSGDMQGMASLKAALEALQADVNRMKEQDIADLRRMAQTFERELASLGVDVQQMKRDLGSLADRVTNLENRLPVDISGGLDFWMGAGMSDDDLYGLTVDGRPTGYGDGDYDDEPVGGTRDLTILHEAALTLTGARKTGPRFKVTAVFGNMIGSNDADGESDGLGFGNQGLGQSTQGSGFDEATSSFYIQHASVGLDSSLMGMAFSADIGRLGYKVSPYIYQRQDVTPYFANDRWDNGEWLMDGAVLGFNFGTAKLKVFGGRTGNDGIEDGNSDNHAITSSHGVSIQELWAGGGSSPFNYGPASRELPIDQMMGFHLNLPMFDNGSLNLAYLWLDANESGFAPDGSSANRVNVLGGDLNFNFGNFMVGAGYSTSTMSYNGSDEFDDESAAWYAQIGLDSNRWGATLGYRTIEANFGAPGDWGRIGTWWNPTDIKGMYADAHIDLTDMFRLRAKGGWYTGVEDNTYFNLADDTDVTHLSVGLEYKMATNWDLMLGFENANLDYTAGGDVDQTWWNIGFGWAVGDNAKWSLLYQMSKEERDGEGGSFDSYKGGLITSQLSVKF